VDLIYNGLPPSEHAPLTIAALAAGKHVLCEKPFAMNAGEAQAMADAAARYDRVLIEAFHYRFHPLFVRLMSLLAAGSIGSTEAVAAHFNVPITYSESEFRYQTDLGGGALMDLGCYAVHWARTVVGTEPTVLTASQELHSTGVDLKTAATLEFPGGELARVSCAMNEDLVGFDSHLSIVGTRGRIDVSSPGTPHSGNRLTLTNDEGRETAEIEGETTFYYQLEHVKALIEGRVDPVLSLEDAVKNMRVLDAIVAAADKQQATQ
jgi:predicted dehydrogenase